MKRYLMDFVRHDDGFVSAQREGVGDYIFDMIHQLAELARSAGDCGTAIHLEAIIAARRADLGNQSL